MNVAQGRPRTWTPHIILFSIVLHAVVIYYIASAFNIVPPLYVPDDYEPRTIQTIYLPPQPPEPKQERVIDKRPLFQQRLPKTPPVQPTVESTPLPPTVGPIETAGPATLTIDGELREQPAVRGLPNYPTAAIRDDKEGVVLLSITIMPDGSVRDVQIVNAKPRGYFEDAAVRSVRTWRYAPSNLIRKNVVVRMDFELKDG